MCILFAYRGVEDDESDYSLILVANRDEHYDRPTIPAAPWVEDSSVIGGRDMEMGREGGTWLAISKTRAKLGALLHLPGNNTKVNPLGRGFVVADYVKSDVTLEDYVKQLEPDREAYNDFNVVSVDNIGNQNCKVSCYSNTNNELVVSTKPYVGYGNSLPGVPFKKVEAGVDRFQQICEEWRESRQQDQLVEELLGLLRWEEKHLPDPELERRSAKWFEKLSSVYVRMPAERYGTRTHTIILVKKSGQVTFHEYTLTTPIDPESPDWRATKLQFEL